MRRIPHQVIPVSVALVAGTCYGLRLGGCPPRTGFLLLALGLALWGSWGRPVSFLALGLLSVSPSDCPAFQPAADMPVVMRVRVTGSWSRYEDGLRAPAHSLWVRQALQVVRWREDVRVVLPRGMRPPTSVHLRLKGYLRRPVAPANGVAAAPGPWTLRVKSEFFVAKDMARKPSLVGYCLHLGNLLRHQIDRRLSRWEQSEESQGAVLVRMLALGQSSRLPGPIARGFRAAGLAHIIALSGLHVGLLVAAVMVVTSAGPPRLRFALAVTLALGYMLLAGARPSLVRATLMMVALMTSWLLQRPPQPLTILVWVAAGMVAMEPTVVADLGFQLTVAATAGILLLAPRLEHRWTLLPEPLRKPLSVSVAAHLFVLPWSLSAFHLISPLSPVFNLIAVPWASVSLTVAFGWVCASIVVPPVAVLLGSVLNLLAAPLEIFGSLPPGALGALPIKLGWWAACSVAISLVLFVVTSGWHRVSAISIAALVVTLSLESGPIDPELVVLDVGQGEAILLRDGGKSLLLDGGGWRHGDIAQRVLLPALTSLGVRRLEGMILSHPDTDHCGGLLALTSYMSVGQLYTSAGWSGDPCVSELLTRPGLEIRSLWRGEQLRFARWHLQTLHPSAGARGGRNNRSLVLLAQTMGRRVLLTGDLEAAGERQVLAVEGRDELGRADLLKVGHHGSHTSTSSAWLDRVSPGLALISCGVFNRYGHPDPRILKRLGNRRIRTFRTDRLGAIRITFEPRGGIRIRFPGDPRN